MISMTPEQARKAETASISIVEFALFYARMSWPVFPLHGKIPFKDSQGYKDATTNREQIQTWWSQHPTANIGLATGERSGIIVLDIDPPEGHFSLKELQATYSPLPETRRSRTGNKGLHFFFQYPNDGLVYKNAVGLIVLLTPSVWLRDWCLLKRFALQILRRSSSKKKETLASLFGLIQWNYTYEKNVLLPARVLLSRLNKSAIECQTLAQVLAVLAQERTTS
jgi:hypothetical protein